MVGKGRYFVDGSFSIGIFAMTRRVEDKREGNNYARSNSNGVAELYTRAADRI
jgi:hypothetical protein